MNEQPSIPGLESPSGFMPLSEDERGLLALSIRQPWAWAILHAGADIENRKWHTCFRGRILIYVGYSTKDPGQEGWIAGVSGVTVPDELDMGGIVGVVEIVDCVMNHPSPWFEGRYGFVLRAAKPVEFTPCTGRPGFFRPFGGS